MQAGDYLVSPRPLGVHHGLYRGDQQVIEYAAPSPEYPRGCVLIRSLDEFTAGHGYRIKPHPYRLYDVSQSFERAESRLGEVHYDALLNNSEQFVIWCVQGFDYSAPVQQLLEVGLTLGKHAHRYLSRPPLETMAVVYPERDRLLASLTAKTLISTTPRTLSLLSATLAAAGSAPLATTAILGGVALFGVLKLYDWLTD
jgi:hypothetical protein